jgi:glutamine synthetase
MDGGRVRRDCGLAAGRWDADRYVAADAVLARCAAEGIEAVRIVMADQHGVTRGKTVTVGALESAFRNGIGAPSTLLLKDTSHATVYPVWQEDAGFGAGILTGASDIVLLPDPTTFQVLPWAEATGWMLADICLPGGAETGLSTRGLLQAALARLADKGMTLTAGLEVEFTILKVEDPRLGHDSGDFQEEPPKTSLLAHGYQHLTEGRMDRMDAILTELRRTAQALGMPVRSVEAEFGPSQVEFVFDPLPGLQAADMMILFRNMVKQVCARHGLHATFMTRPGFKNAMGTGWHLHMSVAGRDGRNLFMPEGEGLSPAASGWIAGLLEHAASGCLLTTPSVNGYKRYQPFQLAPDRIQWARDNRGAMLRVLTARGDAASRIENRVGEPMANPYLYLASQILAGLDGIERGLAAPPPVEQPYATDAALLPGDLGTAIGAFEASAFWRSSLGETFVTYLAHLKRAEWKRYLAQVSDWEMREYFSTF